MLEMFSENFDHFFTVLDSCMDGIKFLSSKTPKTTYITIKVSSREHLDVTYKCEFSPDQWSYYKMDEITEALADQLTMKQNLNRGLLMSLSFHEA